MTLPTFFSLLRCISGLLGLGIRKVDFLQHCLAVVCCVDKQQHHPNPRLMKIRYQGLQSSLISSWNKLHKLKRTCLTVAASYDTWWKVTSLPLASAWSGPFLPRYSLWRRGGSPYLKNKIPKYLKTFVILLYVIYCTYYRCRRYWYHLTTLILHHIVVDHRYINILLVLQRMSNFDMLQDFYDFWI